MAVSSRARSHLVAGIDIGGTKVAGGLVDDTGKIHNRMRVPMSSRGSAAEGFAAVRSAMDALLSENGSGRSEINAIGICAPGPLDPTTGVVLNPPNLPCWRDFPLSEEVERVYRVPVTVDNDANAAALAEVRWGAGRGCKNVFYATIGTGIGTGIILDGRIFHGRTGSAGEGGHVSIDYRGPLCHCGKPGCIEILASGPAIAKRAQAKVAEGKRSVMLEMAGGKVEEITAETAGLAYAEGDATAKEVLDEVTELLSIWLSNMIDILDPEAIIIGGGVAGMLSPFFAAMHERIPQLCVNPRASQVPLQLACYGTDSGIAGGAALCFESKALSSARAL